MMPGARLSFLSSAYAAPVLAHHPDLDEVLTVTGQERLGELVRGLGLSPGEVTPPRLVVTDEEQGWARAFLGESSRLRVVVHPGGFSSRLWKPVHYRNLVLRLAQAGREVLLTGNAAERDKFRIEAGISQWPDGVRDLMGALRIR